MPFVIYFRIDKWTESILSITSSQECSIVQLMIPNQNAYSIGVWVWITTTNACIFCRTDFVANLMTNEKPDLGPQTLICSIKPRKYLSSILSV